MASQFAKNITGRVYAKAQDIANLANSDLRRTAARGLGALVLDLWRRRLKDGVGADGKKFVRLAPITITRKRAYIAGKLKVKGVRRTPFAAKTVPDFAAFSGRLKSDAKVKVIQKSGGVGRDGGRQYVETTVQIDVGAYAARILEYQVKKGVGKRKIRRRYEPGLCDEGTSRRADEDREVLRFLRQVFRRAQNAGGVVTQGAP
jgi:hypothetical protein